jgi:hypothetical protein
VVAQSHGFNPVASDLWSMFIARTNVAREWRSYAANSFSSVFASFRSRVSKPS